jgi:hypothetical protein
VEGRTWIDIDRLEGFSSNMILIFYGNNYALWSNRMQTYLLDIGVDAWLSIVNGYKSSKTPPIDLMRRKHVVVIIKQGTIS